MQQNSAPPPPYPQPGSNAPNKRFKQGEQDPQNAQNTRPPQPAYYLSQQQVQMLHYLQQSQNLTPQQQNVLQQLTHQYKLMLQHQQQMKIQQQRAQANNVQQGNQIVQRPGQPPFPTNQQQAGQNYQQGNRTPQSGTTAQSSFANDGNFSPATGHSQQNMPFKSAAGFTQQISSTTNNSELG